jgi:hypothetical protein
LSDKQVQTSFGRINSQLLRENKAVLDEYNLRIESHGAFCEGMKRF